MELHPRDAATASVADGERVRVGSVRGAAIVRLRCDETIPPGVAFAPMHWGALHAPAGAGAANGLTHGAVDPISKQPELKAAAVRVDPVGGRARPLGAGRARRLVVVGTTRS